MKRFNIADANGSFDDLLEMSSNKAVAIEHDGSDIAVLLSIEEYSKLLVSRSHNELINKLNDESVERYGKVYVALAKNPE